MSKLLKKGGPFGNWSGFGESPRANAGASGATKQKDGDDRGINEPVDSKRDDQLFNWNIRARKMGRQRELSHLAESVRRRGEYRTPRVKRVVLIRHSSTIGTPDAPIESESDAIRARELDWVETPELILDRLEGESTKGSDLETAILFAETTAFDESLRPRLLGALGGFISQHRFSADDDTTTALGSAIRKYAMNMDEPEFDSYAQWLKPSQTETLDHRVELDLAKGACWRLAYEPVSPGQNFPELKSALFALAQDYVTPRLILQKNYASTTLNAIVAVVILDAIAGTNEITAGILEQVDEVGINWFSELLDRRLNDAAEAVEKHNAATAQAIRKFIAGAR